ncbi:MAG: hypothetical protein LC746_12475 [Acidobacteria bacterium]|nr:hypothetical protein [Acidobacteriota bacterium]
MSVAVLVRASAAILSRPAASPFAPATSAAQTRTRRTPRTRRNSPTTNAHDYARFSHSEAAHAKRDCAACHVVASFSKPDITDFPDHPSCVECHRQQFFRGARPAICADCHTTVSPRGAARFPFPRADETPEFADQFPHANHVKTTSLLQFKKVIGEKSNIQATCLYCHKVNTAKLTLPASPPSPTTDARASATARPAAQATAGPAYVAPAGTFMTTPTSHATCFQCHWQKGVADHEQEPYATQCASCHRLTSTPRVAAASAPQGNAAARTSVAPPAQPQLNISLSVLTSLPRRNPFPSRYVPKFVHELDAHKKRVNDEGKEVAITCLTCHAAARKVTTLEALRSKESRAGLPTCSSSACHTATTGSAQLTLSVYRELRERSKDPRFDCALCHTPPLSVASDVPCSHYVAVFASATKEKKGTKGIEQLTPPRCADEMKKVTQ